ncbi:MAG: TetR/AcrR family transcriptional regulator [Bacilli bacterium]
METNKTDKRTSKTISSINAALLILFKQNSKGKITVSEVCKIAGINRGTFYLHYDDINDAISKLENNFYTNLIADIKATDKTIMNTEKHIKDFLDILKNYKSECFMLFCDHCDFTILNKLSESLKKQIFGLLKNQGKDINLLYFDYIFGYIFNGTLSIVKKWASGNMKESTDYMAHILLSLATYDLQSLNQITKKQSRN